MSAPEFQRVPSVIDITNLCSKDREYLIDGKHVLERCEYCRILRDNLFDNCKHCGAPPSG